MTTGHPIRAFFGMAPTKIFSSKSDWTKVCCGGQLHKFYFVMRMTKILKGYFCVTWLKTLFKILLISELMPAITPILTWTGRTGKYLQSIHIWMQNPLVFSEISGWGYLFWKWTSCPDSIHFRNKEKVFNILPIWKSICRCSFLVCWGNCAISWP